jgi:hypothetical protein
MTSFSEPVDITCHLCQPFQQSRAMALLPNEMTDKPFQKTLSLGAIPVGMELGRLVFHIFA